MMYIQLRSASGELTFLTSFSEVKEKLDNDGEIWKISFKYRDISYRFVLDDITKKWENRPIVTHMKPILGAIPEGDLVYVTEDVQPFPDEVRMFFVNNKIPI